MDARIDQDVNFEIKRENIKNFFETEKLRRQVQEFFEVQRSFHAKMNNLMQACRDVYGHLSEEQQVMLERMLSPYGVLIANPFEEQATGDLELDITHIFGVINERNHHFNRTLPALMMSAANLYDFNKLLMNIKMDKSLAKIMMDGIKSKNWSDVESHVSLPFQNLMRYDLLLTTIKKTLVDAGYTATEPVLSKIMDVISYIIPELKYINEHRETLVQFNEVDALVVALGNMEVLRGFVTKEDEARKLCFADKVTTVRLYISEARTNIAKGNVDVLQELQGLQLLLDGLYEGIDELLQKEKNSYYALVYNGVTTAVNFSASFFRSTDLIPMPVRDPREQLRDVIEKLKCQYEQAELIRKMEQKAMGKQSN
jgi:hypothetical protein